MPPAALTAENAASTPWLPWGNDPVSGPVRPLTFPKVIEVGVTPVSEAVLPAVPVQYAASAAGAKLNPAEVGEAGAVGALAAAAAPLAVAAPVPPAAVRTPVPPYDVDPVPPRASDGDPHGTAVVVVDEVDGVVADLGLVVVVEDFDPAVVDVVEEEVVDEVHGTVVAVARA